MSWIELFEQFSLILATWMLHSFDYGLHTNAIEFIVEITYQEVEATSRIKSNALSLKEEEELEVGL